MRKEDKQLDTKSKAVYTVMKNGEELMLEAVLAATKNMQVIVKGTKTKEGRIAALEDNALFMGIGTMFMERVAPKAQGMAKELTERTGATDSEAKMLAAIWLAQVFEEIVLRANDE